jgi:formate dehydrogenase subunit gamma
MNESQSDAVARETCARFANRPDALFEILHQVQEQIGCIPQGAIPPLADALNLSRADLHGVVSFYEDFHTEPGGRHRLKICRAEACQAMQGERIAEYAEQRLGIRFGETSADGSVTLQSVYCLGNCALSPAAMLDEQLVGRLDEEKFDQLIRDCEEAKA